MIREHQRSQLVERAARADHQHGLDVGAEYAEWDKLPGSVQSQYRDSAEAVLDAVQPEVSTLADLEALPGPALLIGAMVGKFPAVFRWTNGQLYAVEGGVGVRVERLDPEFGPLTVVWQLL